MIKYNAMIFLYFSLKFVSATARAEFGTLEVSVIVDINLLNQGAGDLLLKLTDASLKWQTL